MGGLFTSFKLPLFLLSLSWLGISAEIRSLYFNRTEDGSASFRLRCTSAKPNNRCSDNMFRLKAQTMCSEAQLNLTSFQSFNCVKDLEKGESGCKFANGICSKKKEEKKAKAQGDEVAYPDLIRVEELPDASELPKIQPSGAIQEIPKNDQLKEVEPTAPAP